MAHTSLLWQTHHYDQQKRMDGCRDHRSLPRSTSCGTSIQAFEAPLSSCGHAAVPLDRSKNQSAYLYLSDRSLAFTVIVAAGKSSRLSYERGNITGSIEVRLVLLQ
ncbi:MAG TPA: hypothetical protein VK135_03700 [Candidatus Dormibacteraeota bacterium]|nr:hypothetical protein [Candidatus Dormibacteraeota bacterium]